AVVCAEQLHPRKRPGAEGAPALELAAPDGNGRVGLRAAEEVPLGAGFVGRHPRVEDERLAAQPELGGEPVRMRVRGQEGRSRRSAVEREREIAAGDEDIARLGKGAYAFARPWQIELRRNVEPTV